MYFPDGVRSAYAPYVTCMATPLARAFPVVKSRICACPETASLRPVEPHGNWHSPVLKSAAISPRLPLCSRLWFVGRLVSCPATLRTESEEHLRR